MGPPAVAAALPTPAHTAAPQHQPPQPPHHPGTPTGSLGGGGSLLSLESSLLLHTQAPKHLPYCLSSTFTAREHCLLFPPAEAHLAGLLSSHPSSSHALHPEPQARMRRDEVSHPQHLPGPKAASQPLHSPWCQGQAGPTPAWEHLEGER